MEGDDCFTISRLEREMHSRDWPVSFVDIQHIRLEGALTLDEDIGQTKRDENGAVEAFAGFDIGHSQVHMINESATVKLHDYFLAV